MPVLAYPLLFSSHHKLARIKQPLHLLQMIQGSGSRASGDLFSTLWKGAFIRASEWQEQLGLEARWGFWPPHIHGISQQNLGENPQACTLEVAYQYHSDLLRPPFRSSNAASTRPASTQRKGQVHLSVGLE